MIVSFLFHDIIHFLITIRDIRKERDEDQVHSKNGSLSILNKTRGTLYISKSR